MVIEPNDVTPRRGPQDVGPTEGREDGKVVVMNWVTLDGVMQGPGGPDEDTRDGFAHGGWGVPYSDEATLAQLGDRMAEQTAVITSGRSGAGATSRF